MLFSGVVHSETVNGVDGNDVTPGSTVDNIYYGTTFGVNDGPRNLFIGGILQDHANPEDNNEAYRTFADNNNAIYVPTYYSLENIRKDSQEPVQQEQQEQQIQQEAHQGILQQVQLAAEKTKKGTEEVVAGGLDSVEVNHAAYGTKRDLNGLKSPALNGIQYDTIISYSGGTATAVSALRNQGVTCDTLIMISPMKGSLLDEQYKKNITDILKSKAVNKIVVVWSPQDKPTGGMAFYEAQISADWDESKRITVYEVPLLQDKEDGMKAHKDMFFDISMNRIKNGKYVDPGGASSITTGNPTDTSHLQPNIQEISMSSGQSTDTNSISNKSTMLIPTGSAAEALKEQGKYEDYLQDALQSADDRIAHDSQNGDAWYTKGLALYYLKRGAEADAAFAKAKELGIQFESNGESFSRLDQATSSSNQQWISDAHDESDTKEGTVLPTLYPVTSPPPDEEVSFGISQDLEQFSQAITSSKDQSIAKDFQKGDKVVITDLLNVRSEPGLPIDGSHDTRISEPKIKGSTGIIVSEMPIYADGFAWWKIQYDDGIIGWSQDKRLELQPTEIKKTTQKEKQAETQETSNAEFDPYSEGRKLAAEAFKQTYQSAETSADITKGLKPITQAMETAKSTDELNTKENSKVTMLYPVTSPPPDESSTIESLGVRTLHPGTGATPDESNTKENLGVRTLHPGTRATPDESNAQENPRVTTLYPVTNPPQDESNTNSNAVQVSGTDISDYSFLRNDKKSSNLEWAVTGSGDKGRPTYQQPATPTDSQYNLQPIQAQRSSSIDIANSNSNSIVGEWNVVQITTPHALFGGAIQIQFVATFSPDGSVNRPKQQQGSMWIDASRGSWTQNGDSVRWTISEVTHEGTLQGNSMSGIIYSSGGKSSWSAERVGG